MNFSNMTPSHRQQFFTDCCNTGHSSTGCNPSGTASFCVGTPQNHKSCQENVSSIGSSLHRSADLPQAHSFPSGIHLLQCGSSPQAAGESLHPHGFPRAMGDSCLTMGSTTGCRRICAPVPVAPPPLLLHWPWCVESCAPTYSYSTLLCPQLKLLNNFSFLLLRYVTPEMLSPPLTGLALARRRSVLELAETSGCVSLMSST